MTTLADDPLAKMMRQRGIEVTRTSYIAANWMGDDPEPWTIEEEMELPEELRDLSQVIDTGSTGK